MHIRHTFARLFKLIFQEALQLQPLFPKTVNEKKKRRKHTKHRIHFDLTSFRKLHYLTPVCSDHQKFQFLSEQTNQPTTVKYRQTFWDSRNNKWYPKSVFVLFNFFLSLTLFGTVCVLTRFGQLDWMGIPFTSHLLRFLGESDETINNVEVKQKWKKKWKIARVERAHALLFS